MSQCVQISIRKHFKNWPYQTQTPIVSMSYSCDFIFYSVIFLFYFFFSFLFFVMSVIFLIFLFGGNKLL